jgi:hypothetical protein|tara:strand:- start:4516 stop:6168 length:1653 start_codon:yes stop_codon:yes gene_type:complete
MEHHEETLISFISTITSLFEKYKDDTYMITRMTSHITDMLPSTLENEEKHHNERIVRNNFLTNEQIIFTQLFLNKNQYFYLPNISYYYHYTGNHYSIVREDVVHHHILTSISKERKLLPWKHKTKVSLLKMIKERSLFQSIPESDTIQIVLNQLCSNFFSRKNKAKYFLTIIGDNLLKKNTNRMYIIPPNVKKYMSDLDAISYLTTGITNLTSNIVTKYNENYVYTDCRLIDFMEQGSNNSWRDMLNDYSVDLLCVAAHYSNRYGNADLFLETCDDISEYALYMKHHSQEQVFEQFCDQFIEKVEQKHGDLNVTLLNWKNMHYLWKLFVSKYSLPNVMYSNHFKMLLKDKYTYEESNDTFINVTSSQLPIVSDFLTFWDTSIIMNDKGTNEIISIHDKLDIEIELELDELVALFKIWLNEKTTKNDDTPLKLTTHKITDEKDILNILSHYYSNIEIVNNKFIMNVQCSFWNKIEEMNKYITDAKEYYKILYDKKEIDTVLIPINEIYTFYIDKKNTRLSVSKRYFEKYISSVLHEYSDFDGFISIQWLHL